MLLCCPAYRRRLAETKMHGSKKDFTSLPYKNIVTYSVETSGTFDLDSELEIYFSSLGKVKFKFTGKTAIVEISKLIFAHIVA
jgi:hypothetical protein